MSNEQRIDVQADGYFVIIPEWLILAVSGNAVKLYAILRKYADSAEKTAYPSRRTLATDLGFKDPKTIDPLITELVDIKALKVTARRTAKGERMTNVYTVLTAKSVSGGYPLKTDKVAPENGQGVAPENGEELKPSFNLEPLNSEAPQKSAAAVEVSRPDVNAVVDCFSARLTANDVKHVIGKRWHDAARLLIDRDGYTVEQINWITMWATTDQFWKGNILSLPKLREKFEQLKIRALSEREKVQAVAASAPSYWDDSPVVDHDD